MSQDYRVVCLSETISPLTHMSGSRGNVSVVARELVATDRGVAAVPALSGNAIRHRLVRQPGFRWLIDEYALPGRLTLPQLNFLFHGGSLTEGGGRENMRRIAEFHRLFPLGRILGGCLPNQVLAGSLQVHRGTLVCEEQRARLTHVLGETLPPVRFRAAESFLSQYQYTRGDAVKTAGRLLAPAAAVGQSTVDESNLMIFSGQSVIAGAVFVHGFALPHASEVELGALLWSLRLWQAAGGTIGGQSARGHGRLRLSILAAEWDGDAAVAAYQDHAMSVRDEAVAWLDEVFGGAVAKGDPGDPSPATGKTARRKRSPAMEGTTP